MLQTLVGYIEDVTDEEIPNFIPTEDRIADDDVRDYGDPEAAAEKQAIWEECGFNVISMKNDFATIYGEDVVRTSR